MALVQQNFRMSQIDQGPTMTELFNKGIGGNLEKRAAQLTEQERYNTAKARQDELDARAKEQYDLQKAVRQGTLDTESALAQAAPYAKDVAAFENPLYKEALAAHQSKYGPNADITESASILSEYMKGKQPVGGTSFAPTPEVVGSTVGYGGGTSTVRLPSLGTSQTTTKEVVTPGYVDPEATVSYGTRSVGVTPGTKDVPIKGGMKESFSDIMNYKAPRKEVFGAVDTGHQSVAPLSLSNLVSNVKTSLSEGEGRTLALGKKALEGVFGEKDYATVLKSPKEYSPDAIKEALLHTPGMTKEKNIVGSSARDTVLNDKGNAILDKYSVNIPSTSTKYTSKVSDIDTSKVYDSKGNPVTSDKQLPKNNELYMKDPSTKQLVNISTLGKAMMNNYHEGSVSVEEVPVKGKVQTSGITEVAQGAPVIRTSAQHISSIAKVNNIPAAEVAQQFDKVGSDYKSILAMLGTDNTSERNALRQMAQAQAAQSGLTSKDWSAKEFVDTVLPSNDLTQRQVQTVNLALKELDNIRQDKRWAKEDEYKNMVFAHQVAMDNIANSFKAAGLNLDKQRLTLAKTKDVKVPAGYMIDPKYAPEGYISTAAYQAGLKKAAQTPEEIEKAKYENILLKKKVEDSGKAWYNPF